MIEDRVIDEVTAFCGLFSASEVMQAVYTQIRQVAPYKSTVLISGESGTGKELIARAIHTLSTYHDGPFLAVNCSALPEELAETTLFGHVKGAFTGANTSQVGLFEAADRGTLFLDEIGDLALDAQAKLLRVIEDRQVTRIGSIKSVTVDVRILAATHIDLETAVEEHRFRDDLYHRLNVFSISIPPLRSRPKDIPLLVQVFLARFASENNTPLEQISAEALASLATYSWPGNVRELKNTVERLAITAGKPVIGYEDLPETIKRSEKPSASAIFPVGLSLVEVEEAVIRRTLSHTNGNRTQTARILRIGLRTLQRKLKEYGIS